MNVTRHSLLTLQKRYRIDLDELTQWLDTLQVAVYPAADGVDRHATIDDQDIPLLDALHRHLKAGGALDDFSGSMLPDIIPPQEISPQQHRDLVSLTGAKTLSALGTFAEPEGNYAKSDAPSLSIASLRERFEFLDDCAARLWLLTTQQVAAITGLKSALLFARAKESGTFRWQSWTFTRAGQQGREPLWKISSPRISTSVAMEVAGNRPKTSPIN